MTEKAPSKMKFAVNVNTLFKELPFLTRFKAASDFGMKFCEIQDPYPYDVNCLKKTKGALKVVLINAYRGDGYEFGVGATPGEEMKFLQHLSKSLDVAFHLECPKIHIFAGCKSDNFSEDDQKTAFVQNLINAAEVLEEHNIIGLIEPICPDVINNYYLDSFYKAIDIIRQVDKDNIKLLLDVYHLQKLHGNAVRDIKEFLPYAGHIQISQDPGRTEPFLPGGMIDYNEVFSYLQQKEYKDVIGLEYFPSTENTKESLEWLKDYE